MNFRSDSAPPLPRSRAVDGGRVKQKLRTRKALFDAALALCDEGVPRPSLQQVADRALVSRATVYRYFESAEALLHEALLERAVPPVGELLRPGDDPVEAIGRAADAVARLLLEDETGLRLIVRSAMQLSLANPPDALPRRAGRRMNYIEPVLEALAGRLDPQMRETLRIALAMTIGSEAVLAMRDVAGADRERTAAVSAWASRALVRQALADSAAAGPAPAADGA